MHCESGVRTDAQCDAVHAYSAKQLHEQQKVEVYITKQSLAGRNHWQLWYLLEAQLVTDESSPLS